MRPAIIVLAKAPVPGRVKTRLCPPCSPEQAAALAAAALTDTLDTVRHVRSARPVLALDGDPGPWLPGPVDLVAQRGDGLDQRLAAAFTDVGGPALLIGMDTPQVTPALLEAALAGLARADAVLGPSTDGGWWAIGLHEADPAVFLGVPMSAPNTCAAQRQRLRELGIVAATLPTVRDVDGFADAVAVGREISTSRFAAGVREIAAALAAQRTLTGATR